MPVGGPLVVQARGRRTQSRAAPGSSRERGPKPTTAMTALEPGRLSSFDVTAVRAVRGEWEELNLRQLD